MSALFLSGNTVSRTHLLNNSLPQGSVLAPALFNGYISDLLVTNLAMPMTWHLILKKGPRLKSRQIFVKKSSYLKNISHVGDATQI
ncbi:hypothetical protein Y1Q_0016878 [Alligator mississippiensis]|uniref:Reverse transcriptase domain-containing protein n=1 Tax=Alligator mississippiensis TaxID=8496 RepID=A0A151P6R9_ALLMI|nr:hypothetical protein Y1Q_0016878 [Alligator mississippiensis]